MVKLWSSKPLLWVRIPLPLYALLVGFLYSFCLNSLVIVSTETRNLIISCTSTCKYVLFRLSFLEFNLNKSILHFNFEKNIFLWTFYSVLDAVYLYVIGTISGVKNNTTQTNQLDGKLKSLNLNQFYKLDKTKKNTTQQLYIYGIVSIWKHMRFWVLPIVVSLLFVYYSFFLRSLPFSKVIFGYLLLANMFYLFISGFVFFIKKYQYRLFTSAIQRFWRRSLMIFWLIESTLLLTFVYLLFNANQEPVHMYDNVQIYKTHLYSWRYFLPKVFLSALVVVLCYLLLLSLKWNTFVKTNNIALFITVILLYIAWLEFYQLFHLMNCYGNTMWVYDFSEHLWNLEIEFKRTRIVNHYTTIALVAKFWHVIFAIVFWIFFILRGVESSRYRYPLLSASLQNFLIIYVLSWVYMYPWIKGILRKGLDMPYFWFFVNNRKLAVFLLFNDVKLYLFGTYDYILSLFNVSYYFKNTPIYYWFESSSVLGNTQFRKHGIRDLFIIKIQH